MTAHEDKSEEAIDTVLKELQSLEPIFHHPELGTSAQDYERMTDVCYWEVGASGRIYQRDFVIDNLVNRYSKPYEDDWSLLDCHCRPLSNDTYLFTYTLLQWQGTRQSRRSTIWRITAEGWQAIYHQGTLIESEEDDQPADTSG